MGREDLTEPDRRRMLAWLQSLTDQQFADVFYEAVAGRNTADRREGSGHFVLADAQRTPPEPWTLDLIGPARGEARMISWDRHVPIAQSGECSGCGASVRSWAREAECPRCHEPVWCS